MLENKVTVVDEVIIIRLGQRCDGVIISNFTSVIVFSWQRIAEVPLKAIHRVIAKILLHFVEIKDGEPVCEQFATICTLYTLVVVASCVGYCSQPSHVESVIRPV